MKSNIVLTKPKCRDFITSTPVLKESFQKYFSRKTIILETILTGNTPTAFLGIQLADSRLWDFSASITK